MLLMGGVAALVVLVLVALKVSLDPKGSETVDADKSKVIHVSGVYSVLRKSPRKDLAALRPAEEEIKKYLAEISEDVNGVPIKASDRTALLKHWKAQMEMNLRGIEAGDKGGVAFYYYDYLKECPVCGKFIAKGNFVTREEIYNHPQLIPPFHLGCACVLAAHHGSEKTMRETAIAGMSPFFEGDAPPPLPEWGAVLSLSAAAGVKK
ncbi:MAG: hypothetical protein LBC59_02355 [Chitinispirillales bacterium]|jgi:hypothetical protein|nr:hypothetical protein [Chitinispirillales bacterium]